MRIPALLTLVAALFTSCHESERSISVSETRELTLFDQKYPGNIKDYPPLTWRRIHGTEMRIVNYLAGPEDSVEIFMGISQGGVLPNSNRWLGQFGKDPAADLTAFTEIQVLGREAYLVEVSGDLAAGMGNPAKPDQGLIGFVRKSGEDVITLKMTGPAADVTAQKEAFLAYATSLEFVDLHIIPAP
ncbi:MAG: hypothetical protein QNK80_10940 [Akkermansiaceae bacterium]|jgi:hypothetical protein